MRCTVIVLERSRGWTVAWMQKGRTGVLRVSTGEAQQEPCSQSDLVPVLAGYCCSSTRMPWLHPLPDSYFRSLHPPYHHLLDYGLKEWSQNTYFVGWLTMGRQGHYCLVFVSFQKLISWRVSTARLSFM